MRHTRRTAAALAVAAAAAFFTAEARAADSISFGDQGSAATFGANAIVGIDGSITYRTDCPSAGIDDFFYPATDVYLVDAGEGTGTLHDVGGGRPNTIVATTSFFLDEVIAATAPGGNLDEGTYDVVYDTCQDGTFDPGFDTVFPGAVTVRLPDLIPLADGAIQELKGKARDEHDAWRRTRREMEGVFKLADQALKTQCKGGNPIGCAMKKLDYFGGVKERFLTLLTSQANHYLAIAEDPPDPDYEQVTTVAPVDVPRDHRDSAFGNAVSDALPPFAGEAAVSAALLRAIERYQGAQAMGDGEWALVHARQARNLSEALRRIAPASSDALAALRAVVSADAADLDEAIAAGRSFAARVSSTGFNGAERRSLLNQRLTATGVAKLETETRGFVDDTYQTDSATVLAALDQTRAAHSATTAALAGTVAEWDEIVDALEADQDPLPAVAAGGPYSADAGASITLAGTGSGGAWDLDGDGEFDDATGTTPTVTFDRAGASVIGLRAGTAVSYAVVHVAGGSTPVITSPVPAQRSVTVTVGSPREFSVAATGSATWTIDGEAAGSGSSLTFAPDVAEVGGHLIEVTVSGRTRRAWDVIVLDRDPDEDGWTRTTDCDESDPAIHPTAIERLGNGVNDDCDASTPDAPPGGLAGSMRSWGSNHNGTIGNGSSETFAPSPVAIPGYDNVVDVDGGDRAGYALLDNGEVRVWGFPGQLGNGTNDGSGTPLSPLPVGGGSGRLTGITQLAAAQDGHALALRGDGTVVGWGENRGFQVGDGSTVDRRLYPALVLTGEDAPPLTGVRAIEAGINDSFALMEDGTVRSWGYVRCDGGPQTKVERFPIPLPLVGGNVRQISSGNQWTLFLKKDGTVLSCGATPPTSGRPPGPIHIPTQVTGLGPGSGVIDVAAGHGNGMALKADGSLWIWGIDDNNSFAVLASRDPRPEPVQVPLPPGPPVVDIEMDDSCHVLLLRADGSVIGWGCDFFEQLGDGPGGPAGGVTTPTVISMPGRRTIRLSTAIWNSLALTIPAGEWEPPATWVKASVADATVAETGGMLEISLSAALPHDVTVGWSVEAGTAGASDVTLGDRTATVPAGETTVEVPAPVLDDALDENAEAFTVVLRDASHGVQLARSQATVTISDDDGPPSVGVEPASIAEGDTSLADGKVKVRLSKPSGKPVSVAFATADGTATSPADYGTASGRFTIEPGELERIVHVAVRGDTAIEPDEALTVSLSEPENAALGSASAALTIADDEPLALSVSSPEVDEGEPATFTVSLEAAGPEVVSMDYEVVGVTASVPGDVATATGTLTFAPGETSEQVTVQVKEDTEVEGDEAFRLALENIVAARPVLLGESTVATIVDDDEQGPPADTVAPVSTASGHPSGWSRHNVTVALTAIDEGSGVKEITYRIGSTETTVAGASASIPVTSEGTTTIAYRARDNAGNVEAEKTLVVRIDRTAPTATCTASPGTLWPADDKLVPITVKVKVQDSGSGAAGFVLASVTSNEPADGDIRDFVTGTADTTGRLRAERAAKGNGRVYTLKYVARDLAGNERTCTTTVTVPRGCRGARAARAAKEVRQARRRAR